MLTQKKYSGLNLFLTSFVIVLVVITPILIANNGNLYLVGDYMSQQIPFIKEMKRMFFSGAPFWSCNSFLGANFLGNYSFYNFYSPFYIPLYFLPETALGMGLGVVFILKHIVAALSAHLFLKRYVQTPHLSFIGALIYAFSGFVTDSVYFFHFLDVIAVFPLILYFTDEVLEGKKKPLLSLVAFLNCIINYYFFVATSVFFLIYLFFKFKFSNKEYSFKDALRCILFYSIGGFMSMFALLPTALSLLETNKATGSFLMVFMRGLGNIPQLIKILKGIVLPSEGILGSATGFTYSTYNSNVAFLPFFGALFLFISLSRKESVWYHKLFKLLFILSVVPFGNGVFSLFTNVSYTRWWYIFTLMGVLVSLKVIETGFTVNEVKKSASKIIIISAVVTGLPLLAKVICAYIYPDVLTLFPPSVLQSVKGSGVATQFDADNVRYLLVFILLTLISYLPLYLYIKKGWIYRAEKVVPAVVLIIMVSYTAYLANECNLLADNEAYRGNDAEYSQEVSYSYRTDFGNAFINYPANANYPATVNSPGIGAFSSFKSHKTAEFCRLVGYDNVLHLSAKKHFDTSAINSILSVKYTVDKDGNKKPAEYYTPFGFSYDYYVVCDDYEYTTNKELNNKRIEIMTKAVIADSKTAEKISDILTPLPSTEFDWKSEIKTRGCEKFEMNSKGFTAVSNNEKATLLFFSIPNDNGWSAKVNGEETEILTVNGGLMGIIVPQGESEIEFSFVTPGLRLGLAVSATAFLLLFVYSFFDLKQRQREK